MDVTHHEKNRIFLERLVDAGVATEDVAALLRTLPKVDHFSVRPVEEKYDKDYYSQNLEALKSQGWAPGIPAHGVFATTIQEFETTYSLDALSGTVRNFPAYIQQNRNHTRVVYQVFDVHYYLQGWKPLCSAPHDIVHVVGGDFYDLPGRYLLPFHEGHYTINGDAQVAFSPRASGAPYMHNLVHYDRPAFKMNLGWYSIFWDFCHPSDFAVRPAAPTGYSTMNSVQTTYF